MCKEILVTESGVSWIYNNKKVIVNAERSFYATEKEEKYIYIQCGKDFILESVYYYNFDGSLVFSFSTEKEYIMIGGIGKIDVNQLILANFYPKHNIILLLSGEKEKKILGYNLKGHLLLEVESPIGYEMKYFQCHQNQFYVVCEGDEMSTDQYGRFQFNFIIDLDTGKLIEESLAY